MKTTIYSSDSEVSQKLKAFAQDKVVSAFYRFDHLIRRIDVRITDENGPKGGDDKTCSVCIKLNHFSDLVIKDTESDPYVSVTRAISRAKKTLARRLKHSQTFVKQRLSEDSLRPDV